MESKKRIYRVKYNNQESLVKNYINSLFTKKKKNYYKKNYYIFHKK